MKIDQLIYFAETAREEHIGRASKILGISPSAISHSISALEGELQVKLFQKKGKNIFLTNEGQNLYNKSHDLISQFKNLRAEVLTKTEDRSHYTIVASHTLSSQFLPDAWLKTQKNYSQVSIDLLTLRSSEVMKSVLNREADLGICFSPQGHPEIEETVIYEGSLHIVVNKNHPILAKKSPIKEISKYPAVLPKSFQGIEICLQHPMFEQFNIEPQPACLTDSYDISFEMIKGDLYWGLIPDILISSKDFMSINPKREWRAPYRVSLIWRKNKYQPHFYNDFSKQLKKSFE